MEAGNSVFFECGFYMDESPELQNLAIKWLWQERAISNRSKGLVPNQIFTMREFESPLFDKRTDRKMKMSRLEISIVLELNEGVYTCLSDNQAGSAARNYTLMVINRSGDGPSSRPQQEGPSSSHPFSENESSIMSTGGSNVHSDQSHLPQDTSSGAESSGINSGDSVVLGMAVGILFGIVLVMGILILCAQRTKRCFIMSVGSLRNKNDGSHRKHRSDSPVDQMMTCVESEMEKLTGGSSQMTGSSTGPHVLSLSAFSSAKCYPTSPHLLAVNPIEKPPRQRPDCLPYSFAEEPNCCWTPSNAGVTMDPYGHGMHFRMQPSPVCSLFPPPPDHVELNS